MKKIVCFFMVFLVSAFGADDFKKQFIKADKECRSGVMSSCGFVASLYLNGLGTNQDVKKAIFYFEKACDNEVYFACNNLAIVYESGFFLDKDLKKAEYYYNLACMGGFVASCMILKDNF